MYYLVTYTNEVKEFLTAAEISRYVGKHHKYIEDLISKTKREGKSYLTISKDTGNFTVYFKKPILKKDSWTKELAYVERTDVLLRNPIVHNLGVYSYNYLTEDDMECRQCCTTK